MIKQASVGLLFFSFLLADFVFAQSQDARPAYDVATIKLDVSGVNSSGGGAWTSMTADQAIFTNQTLKKLVVLAYKIQPFQVIAPSWMESLRFDITAKYPPGTKDDVRRLMLRTLLEDRFKLTVHHESKEMSCYVLTVGKGGFKLKPSDPGEASTGGGNQGHVWIFNARKTPMWILAYELADSLGTVVVDKTGLDGAYDFRLRWASDDMTGTGGSDANPAPSLFTALDDTLGLSLHRQKAPVDTVVVDRIERVPTAN